jgi:ATP-dependent Clp protease ATP-binding subunit ClpC
VPRSRPTRHNDHVFERFTDRAREVVVGARAEAVALNHDHVGTEHLVLGLLRVGTATSSELLSLLDADIEEARRVVGAIAPPRAPDLPSGHTPFTPRAKWPIAG